jgi:hypothetical protein
VFLSLFMAAAVSAATYSDPQGRYSFTIPEGWQPGTLPPNSNIPQAIAPGGIFTAPSPLVGNVNTVTSSVPPGSVLDQIVTQVRASLAQALPGFEQGAPNLVNATLGGQPALQYDYFVAPQGSPRLHGQQTVTLQNNAVYIVTITAAENDYTTVTKQAQVVLDSFKFGAAPATGTSTTGTATTGTATAGTTTTGTARPSGTVVVAVGTGGATIIPATGMPQAQHGSGTLPLLLVGALALTLGFAIRFRARMR